MIAHHGKEGRDTERGPEPLLTLSGVALRVGERILFAHLDWILGRGEAWAIAGPNGSGKSLLTAALCGRVPVVEGSIRYHFLSGPEACDARYGWFPKGSVLLVSPEDHRLTWRDAGFHQARWHASESLSGATVQELLTRQSVEALNPYQVLPDLGDPAEFERRRSEAVRLFGIEPLLDRRALQLSNGESRKLLLARAVARGPRVLVLDEPFAGLDVDSREALRGALDRLAATGTGLVIATARPEELPSCVARVLWVDGHRGLAEVDRPEAERLLAGKPRSGPARFRTAPEPPAGPTPLVDLREVTVRYGSVTILDRVSLRVEPGQHWLVTGPNGAGKTTLLSLILADHPQAYANHVEVLGRRRGPGESIWDTKARIGWVSPEMHAHAPAQATALELVGSGFFASLGLYQELSTEQRTRALACLERFAPGCARRRLAELSHATQRLVLIARALVNDPPLLVLDEPCHGLDAGARARVLELVDRAARDGGCTLLFVTHQADEVPRSITHRLELRAGRAVRAGARDGA